jgi:hypothetical protein
MISIPPLDAKKIHPATDMVKIMPVTLDGNTATITQGTYALFFISRSFLFYSDLRAVIIRDYAAP